MKMESHGFSRDVSVGWFAENGLERGLVKISQLVRIAAGRLRSGAAAQQNFSTQPSDILARRQQR